MHPVWAIPFTIDSIVTFVNFEEDPCPFWDSDLIRGWSSNISSVLTKVGVQLRMFDEWLIDVFSLHFVEWINLDSAENICPSAPHAVAFLVRLPLIEHKPGKTEHSRALAEPPTIHGM